MVPHSRNMGNLVKPSAILPAPLYTCMLGSAKCAYVLNRARRIIRIRNQWVWPLCLGLDTNICTDDDVTAPGPRLCASRQNLV